ncbi:MAG: hypothetical protein BGP09_00460 [Rhizobium sp. 60-20]|nr:MAG: hypothetical protein BGP09_00460 [Rhizobium sp. 60-20]
MQGPAFFGWVCGIDQGVTPSRPILFSLEETTMAMDPNELQAINTSWQIAIQEILRMVIRDMYHAGGEASFNMHIKRIEEAAVDSIYTDLRLRGTDEWTEMLVKERASNFVTTLLTSFTYDRA